MSSEFAHPFSLLESLRHCPHDGWFLLERHLNRLENSARVLGFEMQREAVCEQLRLCVAGCSELSKVRLLLGRFGEIAVERQAMAETPEAKAVLARDPVDAADWRLAHKTSARAIFEQAQDAAPAQAQDVVLWNRQGELTETCVGNVVLRIAGRLYTPPLRCGLLPGTYRAQLLHDGQIEERVLGREELAIASEVHRINSVRRWTRLRVLGV